MKTLKILIERTIIPKIDQIQIVHTHAYFFHSESVFHCFFSRSLQLLQLMNTNLGFNFNLAFSFSTIFFSFLNFVCYLIICVRLHLQIKAEAEVTATLQQDDDKISA